MVLSFALRLRGQIMRRGRTVPHRVGTLLFGVRHPIFCGGEMKTKAARRGGNITAGVDAKLGQDVTDVVVNGLRGEEELRSDLGVAQPGSQQRQDLQLAGGQLSWVGARARVRPSRDGVRALLTQAP